jgi:MFS family permease
MFGIVPTWGSITVYVTSYLRQFNSSLNMTTTYFIYPLTIFFAAVFMQPGSYLIGKVHPRILIFSALFSMGVALLLASYSQSFIMFVFFYSFVMGFGYGFAYMLPIRNAWLFYPTKKGFVSGVILLCFSLGAILWIQLSYEIINPNNITASLEVTVGQTTEYLYPLDSEVVANVPKCFRMLGVLFLVLALIATLLISKKDSSRSYSDGS